MFEVIIKERALIMLEEAYHWYEDQLAGLGESLLTEVETSINKLRSSPYNYSLITSTYRQLILRRFPYKIIYEINGAKVVVYAVFHAKRNPGKMIID